MTVTPGCTFYRAPRWIFGRPTGFSASTSPGRAAERLFQLLPVPRERIINWDHIPGHDYEADQLIGTSYPGIAGNITPGTARFLQEIGAQWRQSSRPRERVFLRRDGWRRNFANPEPAYAVLREFGFRILDPLREPDVLEACAGAEIVAGVDGSNMANLALAPRDCRILLIFPSECHPVPYNSTLATSGGRPLHVIQGDPLPGQPRLYDAPFELAPERLRSCLQQLCARPSP